MTASASCEVSKVEQLRGDDQGSEAPSDSKVVGPLIEISAADKLSVPDQVPSVVFYLIT